jgi:hypothetical protein
MHLLASKAAAGVAVRILLGHPDAEAVGRRGDDEGIDGEMAAKARNTLVLHRALTASRGAQLRPHATVLYTSVYRGPGDRPPVHG